MTRFDGLVDGLTSPEWLPYVLVGLGLPIGLFVVFSGPIPWPGANLVVGGTLLAVAIGAVIHLIARHGGPGERGPDF